MLMGKMLDRGFRTSFWTVRNQGGDRTRGSRALAVTQGSPFPNAHHVPCTVLMVIITTFIEHSPGTRLCFSEVWLFTPHGKPGRDVLPFLFMGRIGTCCKPHS